MNDKAPENLDQAKDNEVQEVEVSRMDLPATIDGQKAGWWQRMRPGARRNQQLVQLQEGYNEVIDLVRSVRDNLDNQLNTQVTLSKSLEQLPDAVQGLKHLGEMSEQQKEMIGVMKGQLDSNIEHNQQITGSIDRFNSTLTHMDGTTKSLAERARESEANLTSMLERSERRMMIMTSMLVILLILVAGALGYIAMQDRGDRSPVTEGSDVVDVADDESAEGVLVIEPMDTEAPVVTVDPNAVPQEEGVPAEPETAPEEETEPAPGSEDVVIEEVVPAEPEGEGETGTETEGEGEEEVPAEPGEEAAMPADEGEEAAGEEEVPVEDAVPEGEEGELGEPPRPVDAVEGEEGEVPVEPAVVPEPADPAEVAPPAPEPEEAAPVEEETPEERLRRLRERILEARKAREAAAAAEEAAAPAPVE